MFERAVRQAKADSRLERGQGRISFIVKGSWAIPRIPKGFRLKAQSCPDPSEILWGSVHQRSSTPTGLRLLAPDGRACASHNPVGVVLFAPYGPRAVPMDRDNPGLEDAIPLGLNRTAAQ